MAVYLLHFDRPHHHAQHYVGHTDDVQARIERHSKGNGARIVQRFAEIGIGFEVAMVWPDGDKKMEKRIKHRHGSIKDWCPICQQKEDGV